MSPQEPDSPFTPGIVLLLHKAKDGFLKAAKKGCILENTFPEGSIDAVRRFLNIIQEGLEDSDPPDTRELNRQFLSFLETCRYPHMLKLDECDRARALAFHLEFLLVAIDFMESMYRERNRES